MHAISSYHSYYSYNILQYLHYMDNTNTTKTGIDTQDLSAITVSSYHWAKCDSHVVSGN